jgi:hypothetical protein
MGEITVVRLTLSKRDIVEPARDLLISTHRSTLSSSLGWCVYNNERRNERTACFSSSVDQSGAGNFADYILCSPANPSTHSRLPPLQRESALLELSKKRESFPDLAPVLWHSYGTIAALLQEIISIYPMLSPPTLSPHASNRVCNALALLQCVASHSDTKAKLMNGRCYCLDIDHPCRIMHF